MIVHNEQTKKSFKMSELEESFCSIFSDEENAILAEIDVAQPTTQKSSRPCRSRTLPLKFKDSSLSVPEELVFDPNRKCTLYKLSCTLHLLNNPCFRACSSTVFSDRKKTLCEVEMPFE